LREKTVLLGVTSLPGSIDGRLIFAQVDQGGGQSSPVRDTGEEQLRSLIQLVVETLLSDLKNVRDIRHREEFFHVVETVRLRISVC